MGGASGRAGGRATGGFKTPAPPVGPTMQCFKFIKVMMVLFNLLIFLCGAALLAVGIWVSVDGTSFLKIFGPMSSSAMQFVNVGYFLIAAGVVLFVLGFLGCYGAHSENKCALLMFFTILLIIFIAEVAAAVVALVYTTMAETFLTLAIVPAIKKDYGYQTEFTQVWNTTMKEGCFKQLLYEIRTNAVTVGGVAAGIAALEKGTGLESYETNERVPSQGENRIAVRAVAVESLFGLQEALLEP
ncbi:hypothetical protein ACRRTK_016800 [Alexandromys fortis]